MLFDLLQHLSRQNHHGGSAISYLRILGSRDICKYARGRVDDVEQLHHRRAVVCDCCSAILVNQEKVTAVGAECALDGGLDS